MHFIRRFSFISVLALLSSLLTGCLSPSCSPCINTYLLNATNPNCIHAEPTNLTLVVSMPRAAPGYDTAKMAYLTRCFQLSYFARNKWVDTPARMLRPCMIQALQNTCHYKAVVSAPFAGNYQLRLDTELMQLHQDFMQFPSCEHLVLRAHLINHQTRKVIASREFVCAVPTEEDNPYGGVQAANCALQHLMGELVCFCLQYS